MKTNEWIIIGAGAAGLCAAIVLGRQGTKVALLEKGTKVGRKILVSGNGKCNITNRNISTDRFHSADPKFIQEALGGYGFEQVKLFLNSIGLELVEGKDGQMFPMSLQASSVVDLLEYEAIKAGVRIILDCQVEDIDKVDNGFILETTKGSMLCQKLLIASGSPAAPHLGGTDIGYLLAAKMGHTIVPSHPSLVQLCSDEKWVKSCSGTKVSAVVRLYVNGQYVTQKEGDILFTNYGISGLAVLDISREASLRLAENEYCELSIDIMPNYSREKLANMMIDRVDTSGSKPTKLWLQGIFHKKLIPIILKQSGCKAESEYQLNRKEINKLVYAVKNLKLSISGTRGFKGAEVSTGGVNTLEISPNTMESKLVPNLYFAGEVLDIDGDRGGYNFHWAWVCGLRINQIKMG